MGSSSSSRNNNEDHEKFNFRFTDCSCQCDASKKHTGDIHGQNDNPQVAFLTALMTQMNRSQYDIRMFFSRKIMECVFLSLSHRM